VNTAGTNSCDWDWGSKAVSYLQPLVANDGNEFFDGMTDIGLQLHLQAPRHINADGRRQTADSSAVRRDLCLDFIDCRTARV
jgi:hypothetical protein